MVPFNRKWKWSNRSISILITVLFSLASSTVVPGIYEIEQEWADGFLAKISIPIAQRYNHGWLLYIKYETSVVELDVFEAELVNAHPNSKEYVFRNKDYNSIIYYYKDKILHLYLQGNQYPSGDKSIYKPPPDAEVIFVAYLSPTESVGDAIRRVDELPAEQRKPKNLRTTASTTTTTTPEPTTLRKVSIVTTTRLPWMGWKTIPNNILITTSSTTTIPITTKRKSPGISKSFRHNLRDVIKKSLLFYQAQRSGYLPVNNGVPWRSHSALRDGSDRGMDLTGGYYTDGGHVKYGFPTAATISILAWGGIEFKRGYVASKEFGNLLAAIKWGTDYLLKCHKNSNELYVQVSDENTDNIGWMRPEDMRGVRPSYSISRSRPGSDVAAETAAAFAAASIALRSTNPTYSAMLVNHSISLFRFADRYRGKYQDAVSVASSKYKSSGYFDEIAWAAAWLYGVTKDTKYLEISARRLAQQESPKKAGYLDWDNKRIAVTALLAQMTNRTEFRLQMLDFCDSVLVGGSYNYTHKGLLYMSRENPTALACNSAFICLFVANMGIRTDVYRKFAQQQLNYILGDGGQSFVVGYGKNSPKRPYHRASSCPRSPQRCSWTNRDTETANPQELTGALVSGPDIWDNYIDKRNIVSNHVSIYNNAGFQTLAAGILQLQVAMETFSDPEPGELMPAILPTFNKYQDYGQVLRYSNMFYEVQRSGRLPFSNRITWTTSACVDDKSSDGIDLSGGFFDGADYIKFNFPMAFTTTVLAWGMIMYPESYAGAGETDALRSLLRWSTSYFIKCHSSKYELYGQVGSSNLEHSYWLRPEDIKYFRPAFKITKSSPGSELAAEVSAAMAATATVFQDNDPKFSASLIKHAKELYQFADQYRGLYHRSIPDAGRFYPSYNGYKDELVWSSLWLYLATNETKYLTEAKSKYQQFRLNKYSNQDFYWDDKLPGINVLLTKITKKKIYKTQTKKFCDNMIKQGKYTPKGLLYRRPWGSLQYASGAALICLTTADLGIKSKEYRKFAKKQINYILGDGGDRSFVVGYGPMPPKQPYHRASSCPSAPNPCNFTALYSKEHNPHILYGAVVGGPDNRDHYVDDRSNTRSNKVAISYNAAFQSAVAALKYLEMFPPPTTKPRIKLPKTTTRRNRKTSTTTASTTINATTAIATTSTAPTTTGVLQPSIAVSGISSKPTNTTFITTTKTSFLASTEQHISNLTREHHPTTTFIVTPTPITNLPTDVLSQNATPHVAANASHIAISPNSFATSNAGIQSSDSIITTVGNRIFTTASPTKSTDTVQDTTSRLSSKRYCGRQRALELFDLCAIPSATYQKHEDSKIYRCRYHAFKGCVGVRTDNCIDGVWSYWPYWNHHANDQIFFSVQDQNCKDQRTLDIEKCEIRGMTQVFQECSHLVPEQNVSLNVDKGECRWVTFGTCVSKKLDHCKRTWKIWKLWNMGLPAKRQFSEDDMECPDNLAKNVAISWTLLTTLLVVGVCACLNAE